MELVPLVFSSGWASGVNAYLVVLMLGIFGRVTDVGDVPDALTRTDVLVVAGVLYGMEFVADKIPYIDSTWDAISTAIRPTAGAVIAVLLVVGVVLVFVIMRRIRRGWRRWKGKDRGAVAGRT